MAERPKTITFKYVYPEDLRDLYVNGVYGGVTPRNEIFAHLYSERLPIPKKVTHNILDDNKIGTIESSEKGGDVVRFIQTSIVMDKDTAIALRDWLNDRIKFIEAPPGDKDA